MCRESFFGDIKTQSLDWSYLYRTEFSIPLLGKEAFYHFAQSPVTLQPRQDVLFEGPFIQVAGIFLSSFLSIMHGALISHSLPLANTAWVSNQIPEVTVSKDMWYLWIASVCMYILISYLDSEVNWGEKKEKRRAEGSSISCLNKFYSCGVVQAKIQCDSAFVWGKTQTETENSLSVRCQPS